MRKSVQIRNIFSDFMKDESGIGVVEIILILVVLIALIVIFKDKIVKIVTDAFSQINDGAGKINTDINIK